MWGRKREPQANKSGVAEAPSPAPFDPSFFKAEAAPSTPVRPPVPDPEEQRPVVAAINGNGAADPFPAGMDAKTQEFWRGKLATATFGGVVGLLMRSPAHRHFTLTDLEWYLLPPLALGQFMVGETRLQNGQALPLALVLWARVSAEVDARLSAEVRHPVRLQPNEWQSGDVYWILDAVGDPKGLQECIETLTKTKFQRKRIKMLNAKAPNLF
jgi:cytolysin-activating lysine-acyltransferase